MPSETYLICAAKKCANPVVPPAIFCPTCWALITPELQEKIVDAKVDKQFVRVSTLTTLAIHEIHKAEDALRKTDRG